MKKLSIILLLLLTLCFSAAAQKANFKRRTLPANAAAQVGEAPDTLLNDKAINARFKRLLGGKYSDFMDSFESNSPFERKGNYLFSSGTMIHARTHLESAVAIDLVNKTIHAAIFRKNEKVKYFNEDGTKTPIPIKRWANNLLANR